MPIWVADYVLISYGTGAIMAVPAHDERDFEFATEFGIDIVAVVDPRSTQGIDRDAVLAGKQCFHGLGMAINSGEYDGTDAAEFKELIRKALHQQGTGRSQLQIERLAVLRDSGFGRTLPNSA